MEFVILAASCLAGMVLGGIYFGGLWWTVRRVPQSGRPGRLLLASWMIRMTVLCGGLFLVMQNDWKRLASAFLGVLIVRGIAVRVAGRTAGLSESGSPPLREAPHGN